jgi:hypothetical protein
MNSGNPTFDTKNPKFFGENAIMKKLIILLVAISTLLAVSACGGTNDSAGNGAIISGDQQNNESSESAKAMAVDSSKMRLTEDYTDALSTQAQLALGTIQLEQTDLAVNEKLASELLPLWQALQSLSNSDTAAEIEINAVINQIQDTMEVEQLSAIADMKLTEERMTAMIESGEIAFGRGNFTGERGEGDQGGFAGGGPGGGGLLGGGQGGPGGGLGGRTGGGRGDISDDDLATRQAQFAEGSFGGFQDRMLAGTVIRLLQTKTGEATERVRIFDTVLAIVSEETGLSMEDIQGQMSEGITLAEIINNDGGDRDSIRTSLIEAFQELPNAVDRDIEQLVDDWLDN